MNTKVYSATPIGIEAHLVDVEIDLSLFDNEKFFIVGLADTTIKESRKRISTALKNSAINLPSGSITVNLAPANLKKEGTLFDLPIAVGILQACNYLKMSGAFLNETIFIGELSLDGTIKSINGALPIAHDALKLNKKRIILPIENAHEAALIPGVEVIGVHTITELVKYLHKQKSINPTTTNFQEYIASESESELDFSDVKGQNKAKRVLQIAAAGRHNVIFSGPPGSGKTMLAKRLPTILPCMTFEECIETTKLYSISGKLNNQPIIKQRPFRSPHHTVSSAALIGGGSYPKPGEVSLAHNGVLFLDEFIEFGRVALESLRQPLEDKIVEISRVQMTVKYPAEFLMVAAYNPCPCGYYGDTKKKCVCTVLQVKKYQSKLSGPLMDRIDIKAPVNSISYDEAQSGPALDAISSKSMKIQVEVALRVQEKRFGNKNKVNSQMTALEVDLYCKLTSSAEAILKLAFDRLNLSMRSYHKTLKVARTIADMDNSELIDELHIKEAIIYRS